MFLLITRCRGQNSDCKKCSCPESSLQIMCNYYLNENISSFENNNMFKAAVKAYIRSGEKNTFDNKLNFKPQYIFWQQTKWSYGLTRQLYMSHGRSISIWLLTLLSKYAIVDLNSKNVKSHKFKNYGVKDVFYWVIEFRIEI